jgi:hypothetical protein
MALLAVLAVFRWLSKGGHMKHLAAEIYAAVKSGKLKQPFNAAMLEEACPGRAAKTYSVFMGRHAVGNGKAAELFVRVGPGLYRIK